eukprot:12414143-Karenia_brevis.AAC.1
MRVDPGSSVSQLPTPSDLARLFKKAPRHKAIGEGLVDGLLFALCPNRMADLYMPLYLKMYVTLRPPLQWKGGMLHELYKGKGPKSAIPSYRDMSLADQAGKSFSKNLRSDLFATLGGHVTSNQFGAGLNG